ncbi:MAG: methionine synthase [Treponema sp.]|jgi:5-methyltetrahydrofolate--homocysteine methyltransferase|nr:methionine synthase [Treponema sp.]
MNTRKLLDSLAAQKILILDGAMGTMIQTYKLQEADFRGGRFAKHPVQLSGCNDLLCLTKPGVISAIHEAYLEAGADIIETCSFNANALSLDDFQLADFAYEISAAAASLARNAADRFSGGGKPRFVAGSMGPTSKSAAMSPDMEDPGRRGVSWDALEAAYYANARGLLDGGADILLLETVYDTLNAKAALAAIRRLLQERKRGGGAEAEVPVMISATIAGKAGRLLAGQTVDAFLISILHAQPWAAGLNCSFGAEALKPHLGVLAGAAPCWVSVHPNAGLPNRFGEYDESPRSMAASLETLMREGLVNIAGGCCGSTPAHIAAIAEKARSYSPRAPVKQAPAGDRGTCLAGLNPLILRSAPPDLGADGGAASLTLVGERTNVAGSPEFLGLIKAGRYEEALRIPRDMISRGARIINVGMDDPFLDAETAMVRFLNLALADPDIAQAPCMIDSSRWEVIEAALRCVQGKALVNSLSLKEGEGALLAKASRARSYGAAVVVMLFDEQGQAASYERKIAIAGRSYQLLTEQGFPPEDIVFDPNILSVATGIAEHDRYALDFIRACAWIREHCPAVQISGGLTNLSFCFRGNRTVREAMHAVFLKHAVRAGLTMAIVNPAAMVAYEAVPQPLRDAVEDLILFRNNGGTTSPSERLLAAAEELAARQRGQGPGEQTASAVWRGWNVEERIVYAMLKGADEYIQADVLEFLQNHERPLALVEGPLMRGMREVGDRFEAGELYLPQVIRSARVMKKAAAALEPLLQEEKSRFPDAGGPAPAAKILLATVKGDVHDIGKNIVSVVLGCNGYTIIDLGVMVPPERIVETTVAEQAALIGLSGLITPSLDEMVNTARSLQARGLDIPLLIGGATASLAHTALRIAPEYAGPVIYVPDASRAAETARSLLSDRERPRFLEALEGRYRDALAHHQRLEAKRELLPLEAARNRRFQNKGPGYRAPAPAVQEPLVFTDYPLDRLIPHIDWPFFLRSWELGPGREGIEAPQKALLEDAQAVLRRIQEERLLRLRGVVAFFPARSEGDDVILYDPRRGGAERRFAFLRNQEKKYSGAANPCLSDFIDPGRGGRAADWIGLFALSAGFGLEEAEAAYAAGHDDYSALLAASLANCLAEAFSAEMHRRVQQEFWACGAGGVRPAFGYPACPDHQDKRIAFELLGARERCGMELTETAMIRPAASVCGLYIAHPSAYYFGTGPIGEDQLQDWARRKGAGLDEARRRLGQL